MSLVNSQRARTSAWVVTAMLSAPACGEAPTSEDAAVTLDVAVTPDAPAPPDAVIADAGPPLRVLSVEDIGALPHPSDAVAGRDGASSGVIAGRLLWTFGDTFLYTPTPVDGSHVASATGAWATVAAPLTLEQPVDSEGIPPQMIPYTDDELVQNRASAINGWGLWPGALIDTGEPELLMLFQRIKRTEGVGFDGVGLGTARIGPGDAVARRDPDDLFSRPLGSGADVPLLYGPGGVATIGDTVYFFACDRGACSVARVPRARADERAAFEFYDGASWVPDIMAAAPVIRGVAAAHSVSYNVHLGRYLSISSALFSNDVILRTAEHVEGPWPTTGIIIRATETGILAAGESFNYLAQEQVALSSADGRSVVISYSRPFGSFRGEVRLARITLE